MQALTLVAVAALGYLVGSVPSGYLVGRLWGVDAREFGEGRTGATNQLRSAGVLPGLLTGALDFNKGASAAWLAGQVTVEPAAEVLAGAAAILGHNHSILLRCRGGAGVGTSLGALMVIYPPASVGLVMLLFLIVTLTSYTSIASLTVVTLMPIVLLVPGVTDDFGLTYVQYGLLAWAIALSAHKGNIRRLMKGMGHRRGGEGQLRS